MAVDNGNARHPCPRDGAELESRSHLDVDFMGCRLCGGLWFGRDGLERLELRAPKGSSPPRAAPQDPHYAPPAGKAICICRGHPTMRSEERLGVTVDHCPSCGAVWLDAGEIERILQCYREPGARGEQPATGSPPPLLQGAAAVADIGWGAGVVGAVLEFLGGPLDG